MTIVAIIMLVLGGATMAVSFILNSSTPMGVGPIPFFAGAAFALIGLIGLIARMFR